MENCKNVEKQSLFNQKKDEMERTIEELESNLKNLEMRLSPVMGDKGKLSGTPEQGQDRNPNTNGFLVNSMEQGRERIMACIGKIQFITVRLVI